MNFEAIFAVVLFVLSFFIINFFCITKYDDITQFERVRKKLFLGNLVIRLNLFLILLTFRLRST